MPPCLKQRAGGVPAGKPPQRTSLASRASSWAWSSVSAAPASHWKSATLRGACARSAGAAARRPRAQPRAVEGPCSRVLDRGDGGVPRTREQRHLNISSRGTQGGARSVNEYQGGRGRWAQHSKRQTCYAEQGVLATLRGCVRRGGHSVRGWRHLTGGKRTPGGAQHAADTGRSTAPGTAGPAAAGAGRPAGSCARRGGRTPDCGVSAPAGGPGGPGAGGSGAARAPAGAARSGVALATRARLRGRCCRAPAGGGGGATCSSAPPATMAALSLALLVCPSSSTAWSSEALAEGCSAALLESEGTSSTGCAAAYVRRAGWRRSRAPRRCIAAALGGGGAGRHATAHQTSAKERAQRAGAERHHACRAKRLPVQIVGAASTDTASKACIGAACRI